MTMTINNSLTTARLFRGGKVVGDVRELNEVHGIGEVVTKRTVANMGFIALALCGEAGELGNIIKKIWRDGESKLYGQKVGEEIVDCFIYLIMLIDVLGIDIDEAWENKFDELTLRFKKADPQLWKIDNADRILNVLALIGEKSNPDG